MKKIFMLMMLFASSNLAVAQPQQQALTPEQYAALIQTLQEQRDMANNVAAQSRAELMLARKEIGTLRAKTSPSEQSAQKPLLENKEGQP